MNLINILKKYDCLKLNLFLLIIMSILFTIIELYRNKFIKKIWNKKTLIEKLLIKSLILLHHVVLYIMYISPLLVLIYIANNIYNFNKPEYKIYYILYIILSLIAIISWILFDNYCVLTLMQNKLLEVNKNYRFRYFFKTLKDEYYLYNTNSNKRVLSYIFTSIFIAIFTYLLIKK